MLPRLTPVTFIRSLYRIVRGRPQVPPSLAGNALLESVLRRRSVRSFRPEPIPEDVFAAILEAGRVAPSTVNLQTWSFAAFTPETWQATFNAHLPFGAQRAVIVMADTHRDKMMLDVFPDCPLVEYTIGVMNASLAAMNMNVAAEALGVSSVMLSETGRTGLLDVGYLREKLGLPERGVVPLLTIVFGYARGGRPPMPPKLPVEEVCFEGRYREAEPSVMKDWFSQMLAGYQASNLGATFEGQLKVYISKIGKAEEELRGIVYGENGQRLP